MIVFSSDKLDLQLARASIPHGETPSHNDAASIRGKESSRTSISKGGVAARTVFRYGTHSPIRQFEATPVGRDSSSAERKKQRRVGTSHRLVSPSARVMNGPVILAGRYTLPGPIPPRDNLYLCVNQRLGCSIPGIAVEWAIPTRHINWLDLRAVLIAIQLLQFRLKGKKAVFMIDNSTSLI